MVFFLIQMSQMDERSVLCAVGFYYAPPATSGVTDDGFRVSVMCMVIKSRGGRI